MKYISPNPIHTILMNSPIADNLLQTIGNFLHGLSSWVGLDSTVSNWVKHHSEDEITNLMKKISEYKAQRNDYIDDLRDRLNLLNDVGLNVNMSSNVAQAFRDKKQSLKRKLRNAEAKSALADDASNILMQVYTEEGKLGDSMTGYKDKTKRENTYKEVINNVQKEFQKEQEDRL